MPKFKVGDTFQLNSKDACWTGKSWTITGITGFLYEWRANFVIAGSKEGQSEISYIDAECVIARSPLEAFVADKLLTMGIKIA